MDLVKITILKNNTKIQELDGRLIKKDKKNYILAIGRVGRYSFNIKDTNKKIHWGHIFEIPTYDLNILKTDVLLKLDIRKNNINYKLNKRYNDLNLNDFINIKIINKFNNISFNDNLKFVSKIPNIYNKGIIGKIININIWEPPPDIEKNNKTLKIIPGSFTVGCGKYSKTYIHNIDTSPLYNANDISFQSLHEINKADCIFTIHFRDINLIYNLIKL